ncbi:MAG: hypothetical protein IIA62_06040 [Nitrospinae bacterium]|nr:hypothetical protein [Nitrospinota bacterium]
MKISLPWKLLNAMAWGIGFAVVCLSPVAAAAAFQEPLKNSCVACHRDLPVERLSRPVTLWASSVHAEVGNTCDGCHGGDPDNPTKNSMSAKNNFYAAPKEEDIINFCGKCHRELADNFQTSEHAITETQNCIGCHGSHAIRRISIEIINPEKCGACHDYESADKLKTVLLHLHDRFEDSKEKILQIRGLPTQPLEDELGKVWKQLRQVRMVSHTFDMTRIEKRAEEVQTLMQTMESEIARLEDIGLERKFLGLGLIGLFVALAITTWLYNRTEKKTS